MMWMVIRSSSSIDVAALPVSPKKPSSPFSTTVISPLSIESDLISLGACGSSCVLAMSSRIRRLASSAALAALPMMMSTVATSLRSVLAVKPSQKMLTPPSTTGIDAESVVLTCHGASPLLGAVLSPRATASSAETTRSTKTLLPSVEDGEPTKSTPSGMLNETKLSGMTLGLTHMAAAGAHAWLRDALNAACASKLPASHAEHFCVSVAPSTNTPRPARTESSGTRPLFAFTSYWEPSVKVSCT
mmetsp:Transcript_27970/g.66088  ORF Transcript_27970/g.66088 Transcript_27970/m.66088 type:complete len:245 (+) Transcript_27970:557-1291(+)